MSISIKIKEYIYKLVKESAEANHRTLGLELEVMVLKYVDGQKAQAK